ncbi:hypothetical protein HDU76_004735 [Blyttiomyces sp. JEL0837]|nr:hypothetical protein HDU76_004735 [Blyttiomyces sp. JEL0837]
MLRMYLNRYTYDDWDLVLPYVIFAYCTQDHAQIKNTPFLMMYSHDARILADMFLGTPPHITPPGTDNVSKHIVVSGCKELEGDRLDSDLTSLFFMPDRKNILETVPHTYHSSSKDAQYRRSRVHGKYQYHLFCSALLKKMYDYKTDIPLNPLLSLFTDFAGVDLLYIKISADQYKRQAQGMSKFLGPLTQRFSQKIKHTTSNPKVMVFVYAAPNVTMDYDSGFYYDEDGMLTHHGEPIITIDNRPTGVPLWNSKSLPIVLDHFSMTGSLTFLTTRTEDESSIRANPGLT